MNYADRIRQLIDEVKKAALLQPVFDRKKYEHSIAALEAGAAALDEKDAQAQAEEGTLDYFNKYIAGDR